MFVKIKISRISNEKFNWKNAHIKNVSIEILLKKSKSKQENFKTDVQKIWERTI